MDKGDIEAMLISVLPQLLLLSKVEPFRGQSFYCVFFKVVETEPFGFRGAPLRHPHAGSELPRVLSTRRSSAHLQKHPLGGKS